VYLNGLDIPVFLSWVWLKRDGKRVQRFVISTKPMKGKTIARWGKRRWQIEGFFKTVKHGFSLHRFGQKTLRLSLSLANSFFYFLFISKLWFIYTWETTIIWIGLIQHNKHLLYFYLIFYFFLF
jgi:hypothetical protein